MLKRILHDWNDETCVTLLRHCRSAMAEGDGCSWWIRSFRRATGRMGTRCWT
ncbi:hypothetical protein LXT21_34485 [Myxococcus sp. K38C18041901]|uniref:methyltransferase n=1 Tax=Myxococcus guangdongensis TaxID=2906760 RepID=UPI0020A82D64|nr:methyltransferase [Myxococcus guangdongensis]MCP3063897.1 hypothetical protein [Myxococcus guangdongensis]